MNAQLLDLLGYLVAIAVPAILCGGFFLIMRKRVNDRGFLVIICLVIALFIGSTVFSAEVHVFSKSAVRIPAKSILMTDDGEITETFPVGMAVWNSDPRLEGNNVISYAGRMIDVDTMRGVTWNNMTRQVYFQLEVEVKEGPEEARKRRMRMGKQFSSVEDLLADHLRRLVDNNSETLILYSTSPANFAQGQLEREFTEYLSSRLKSSHIIVTKFEFQVV